MSGTMLKMGDTKVHWLCIVLVPEVHIWSRRDNGHENKKAFTALLMLSQGYAAWTGLSVLLLPLRTSSLSSFHSAIF